MTESDSEEAAMVEPWIAAMAESWNLMSKARDFIMTSTSKEVAVVTGPLFMRQESSEYKSALALYECCVANFAGFFTLKLLKVYWNSSNGLLRFRMIYLLSEAIAEFRNRNFQFSLSVLRDAKPLVISCLKMKETKESDIKILRRIVSFVAYNVVMLDVGGWDELNDCILELVNSNPLKAFHVFLDVPAVYENFIKQDVMQKILDKAEMVLLNPEKGRVQDWNLAFETVIKIGVQVTGSDMESSLIESVLKSANEVVENGLGEFVDGGLEDLKKFLARDGNLCKYNKDQRTFVSDLAFKIAYCHKTKKQSKKVAREISPVVRKPKKYSHDHISGFDIDWCNHLTTLSSLEILRIFASTDLEERSRELAIRRLSLLLSEHTSKKVEIDILVMRQLQSLLISCVKEDGLSDSMFKVLGEVVFHVANEIVSYQEDKWLHLLDHNAKHSSRKRSISSSL